LFDEVPFYSESLAATYGKIMDHKKTFAFPEEGDGFSDEARHLITRMICDQDVRIGKDGAGEIKGHPWFIGFDWETTFQRKSMGFMINV
jgi:serine/threonine-protein kinase MRCK